MSDKVTTFLCGFVTFAVLIWLLLIFRNPHNTGFKAGIAHCLSRPIPQECVAMDTTMTITPRGK